MCLEETLLVVDNGWYVAYGGEDSFLFILNSGSINKCLTYLLPRMNAVETFKPSCRSNHRFH